MVYSNLRPVEHDLYHACFTAAVEIDCGIIPLLETGVIFKDPSLKETVLTSLRELLEQLDEASNRFLNEVGEDAIRRVMDLSAIQVFTDMGEPLPEHLAKIQREVQNERSRACHRPLQSQR